MSPGTTIASGTVIWAVNGFLAITLGIVSWNVNREFQRNDDQERRIQMIEKACVKMDYMSDDIKEIKTDLKKMVRGNQ